MFLILLILVSIGVVLFLFIGGVIITKTYNALNQDVDIGQVNLANLTSQTFGVYYTTYLNQADWWGSGVIFGMILGLMISAFVTRGRFPKAGLILDIGIIIAFFILSIYISNSYETLAISLNNAGETFLDDYAPKTSNFILNLPIYTVIIGVICMILFHSPIPKRPSGGQSFIAT